MDDKIKRLKTTNTPVKAVLAIYCVNYESLMLLYKLTPF